MNDRLCRNYSNAEIFHASKAEYQTALKNSGYKNNYFKSNQVKKKKIMTDEADKVTSYSLTHHLVQHCQQMLQNDS